MRDLVAQVRLVGPYPPEGQRFEPMRDLVAYESPESASSSPDWRRAKRDCARCWLLPGSSPRCQIWSASEPDWPSCWRLGNPLQSSGAAACDCGDPDGITRCRRGNGGDDRLGRPSPVLSHAQAPKSRQSRSDLAEEKEEEDKKRRGLEGEEENPGHPKSRRSNWSIYPGFISAMTRGEHGLNQSTPGPADERAE